MPGTPRVSIVTPVFNGAGTIAEAIHSAQRQTFRDWELIVVDDGSTDATVDVVRAIGESRVRVERCGNQAGPASARNRGVALARGEFVAFLDSDDVWMPDKLERQVDVLERTPDAAAAYTWTAFIDERGRFMFAKDPSFSEGDVFDDLLVTFFIASGSNVMARRRAIQAVGGFDESLPILEDWEFWLRFAKRWRFALVPRYMTLYRFRVGSRSSRAYANHADAIRLIRKMFCSAPEHLRARQSEAIANLKQHVCILQLTKTTEAGARRRAWNMLLDSVRVDRRLLRARRSAALALAVIVLAPLPRAIVPAASRALMRQYGRLTSRRPELQALRSALLTAREPRA